MTDPRIIALPFNPGQVEPGPFSEHDLREQWNAQADEFNQWESLDSSEQLAWAQTRTIAAIPGQARSTSPMLDANPTTCQGDEHMSGEAKQSNPPTGSVVIGEDQNMGVDEIYCDWYRCPKCKKESITRSSKFCPDCGVKLQWEGGVTDA